MYFKKRGRENCAEKLKFSLKEEKVEDPEKSEKFLKCVLKNENFLAKWPGDGKAVGPGGPSVRGCGS